MLNKVLSLLLILSPSTLFAFGTQTHKEFASVAASTLCGDAAPGGYCAELEEHMPFLLFGAEHEDDAAKGHDLVFNGVRFSEEEPERYGPCREKVFFGEKHMYCNHYFFVDNFQSGGPEGSCGSNMLEAITPKCGLKGFQWESARQRGVRLWSEKVIPYYNGGKADSKARAYYWLGRVLHLLTDMAVPAHDVPHKMGHVEFEHRSFEYEAPLLPVGAVPRPDLPADLSALFIGLARTTVDLDNSMRAEECRRSPEVKGCDRMRATPTRPLESFGLVRDTLLTDGIMKGKPEIISKPEIVAERALAARELKVLKPLAAAYAARLLELLPAQARTEPVDMPAPVMDEDLFAPRSVNFDGI